MLSQESLLKGRLFCGEKRKVMHSLWVKKGRLSTEERQKYTGVE